jgi:hypothetical protein
MPVQEQTKMLKNTSKTADIEVFSIRFLRKIRFILSTVKSDVRDQGSGGKGLCVRMNEGWRE